MNEATAEIQRLSNSAVQLESTQLPSDQFQELLRLRGEVAELRVRTNQSDTADIRDPKIGELEIVSARYGVGTNIVDVTLRVIELLHRENTGFKVSPDWLKTDPAPYKNKALLIVYNSQGKPNIFNAPEGTRIKYQILLDSAEK
ncbi:MAG: hypothetical protein ABJC04_12520 [Verrucomicrobiota bacterium]